MSQPTSSATPRRIDHGVAGETRSFFSLLDPRPRRRIITIRRPSRNRRLSRRRGRRTKIGLAAQFAREDDLGRTALTVHDDATERRLLFICTSRSSFFLASVSFRQAFKHAIVYRNNTVPS